MYSYSSLWKICTYVCMADNIIIGILETNTNHIYIYYTFQVKESVLLCLKKPSKAAKRMHKVDQIFS